MFIYKFCQKCQKINHKKRENCIRCGDQLLDNPRFGKNVFAVTLSIVILLSATGVYAGNFYLNQKLDTNSQSTTPVQVVEPVASPEPVKEETATVPAVQTPAKKETTTTPQVTTPPAAAPACDVAKKTELTDKYNNDIYNTTQKHDQRLSDERAKYASAGDNAREGTCKDIWDPNQRGICVSNAIELAYKIMTMNIDTADTSYNADVLGLTAVYDSNLKVIHCLN